MKKYNAILFFFFFSLDNAAGPKNRNKPNPTALITTTAHQPQEAKISSETETTQLPRLDSTDSLGSRQNAHSSPLLNEPQGTPRLSVEEIKTIEAIQKEANRQLSPEELQKIKESSAEGWITGMEEIDGPSKINRPSPKSWLEFFAKLPKAWWQEHVTDKNRVEHFMRYAAVVRTYAILLEKYKNGKLAEFINDLNRSNDGEGNRWLDEALVHAVNDQLEDITRTIMKFSIPYREALSQLTLNSVRDFLLLKAEQKRKALEADNIDYALDMLDLAKTIQSATATEPKMSELSIETLEEIAKTTASTLTKGATAGYLPRIPEKK